MTESEQIVLEAFVAVDTRDNERLKRISHPEASFAWPESLRPSQFRTVRGEAATNWEEVWEPFQPLPDLGSRFDLITGFAVCFNSHGSHDVWGIKEWEFFLDDLLKKVITEPGEIYFELNPEKWGCYTPELGDFFRRRGASVEGKKISFRR